MATPLIDVYVKLPTGRTSVLKLLPTEQVKRIIEHIAKEENILPGRVRVKYQGKFLDKSKAIGFLGIRPETILKTEFVIPRDIKSAVERRLDVVSPKIVKSFQSSGTSYRPCNTPLYETSITEESVIEVTIFDRNETDTDHTAIDDDLKDAVLSSFETNGKNVEVVFSFDTTGSMSPYLENCYEWVLHKAQQLDWSEDSAKALVVIGDQEPHPPSYTDQKINWHTELDVLKGMGVKVYGVYCNSHEGNAEKFYEELADRTGGCLLRLATFSLITEMFLGVCYKESNQEHLEAFTEELKLEGKLTEETKDLMKQLEDTKPSEERKTKGTPSYLKKYKFDWWNFKKDHNKTPQYSYNSETDKWKQYNNPTQVPPSSLTSSDINSPMIECSLFRGDRHKKRRGCNVM